MVVVLVKYNKIINDAFEKLSIQLPHIQFKWLDLSQRGKNIDLLSYSSIKQVLHDILPFDCLLIGDVFWPTGQEICKWGKLNHKPVCFLQHGQWIYTDNKKELKQYPMATFVYGRDVAHMANRWVYAKHSKIFVTGTPRYDNLEPEYKDYIYFSPPVIQEVVNSQPKEIRHHYLQAIQSLIGIDSLCSLVVQPHYREAKVDMIKSMFPFATYVSPADNALKWISGSKKVICCRNSTVVLDAIACKKHVLLTDFASLDKSFYRRGYFGGFAKENSCASELATHLHLNNKEVDNYEEVAGRYILLGNSSARIESILYSIMNGDKKCHLSTE